MVRKLIRGVLLVFALVALGLAFAILRGPAPGGIDDVWTRLAGQADLGPADFATLRRRRAPNDALVCPPAFCEVAKSDLAAPVFAMNADDLRRAVRAVAEAEPGVERVYADARDMHDRYVARSRFFRFPDTIDVEIIPLDSNRSTLALYSRSQLGSSDFGVNLQRLRRWLDALPVKPLLVGACTGCQQRPSASGGWVSVQP